MSTEADVAPRALRWDAYEIATRPDPYAGWRAVRERDPLARGEDGVWLATSHALVDRLLKDARFGAGDGVAASFGTDEEGRVARVMATWLMSRDGAPHDRARALVRRSFTPRAVEALAPTLQQIVDRRVADLRDARNEVDLVEGLAFAVPSGVMQSLFGFDDRTWRGFEALVRGIPDDPGASLAMIEGLAEAFTAQLEKPSRAGGLLEALGRPDDHGDGLDREEIVANAVLLLTAGIDTTAGLIASALHLLLERDELRARIATEPGFSAAVVEETLRFESPAISCSRRALEDVEIEGRSIRQGESVLLGLAAANRDPDRFSDPDRFDPDRAPGAVLSFGGGRHHCLGAPLARLEARLVLEALFAPEMPGIRRVAPPTWQRRNPTVRALERLSVRIEGRTS